jgi:outer membrane immunogenic protein
MKLIQIVAAAFFFLFGASAAYAGGGLTDYTPLPAASSCGGPFSGLYGGALLGLGGLNSKADVDFGEVSTKDNDRGFTIGGVGGYNWQCNGRLLGIESDISYFNANAVPGFDGTCCDGGSERANFGSEINWFGTLRARVGLVGDQNFLIFATGGLAYGGIDHSIGFTGDLGNIKLGSSSDTQVGWTAGGGVEYLLSDHWSFRADALYVDLGSEDHTFTTTDCEGECSLHASWDDNFWVARVGLTYLFGAPTPVAYAPLK